VVRWRWWSWWVCLFVCFRRGGVVSGACAATPPGAVVAGGSSVPLLTSSSATNTSPPPPPSGSSGAAATATSGARAASNEAEEPARAAATSSTAAAGALPPPPLPPPPTAAAFLPSLSRAPSSAGGGAPMGGTAKGLLEAIVGKGLWRARAGQGLCQQGLCVALRAPLGSLALSPRQAHARARPRRAAARSGEPAGHRDWRPSRSLLRVPFCLASTVDGCEQATERDARSRWFLCGARAQSSGKSSAEGIGIVGIRSVGSGAASRDRARPLFARRSRARGEQRGASRAPPLPRLLSHLVRLAARRPGWRRACGHGRQARHADGTHQVDHSHRILKREAHRPGQHAGRRRVRRRVVVLVVVVVAPCVRHQRPREGGAGRHGFSAVTNSSVDSATGRSGRGRAEGGGRVAEGAPCFFGFFCWRRARWRRARAMAGGRACVVQMIQLCWNALPGARAPCFEGTEERAPGRRRAPPPGARARARSPQKQ